MRVISDKQLDKMGKLNLLRRQPTCEVTFDDFVLQPDGDVDFHPDLTTHISGPQWANAYDAMAFSLRRGIVMNVHITFVWARLGVYDDQEASERLEDFCAVLRKRAQVRQRPCAYFYAHENSRDEGLHTHLLCVWPYVERAEFRDWVEQYAWTKIDGRGVRDPKAVYVCRKRDEDVQRHWDWFGYVTKGTWPRFVCSAVGDRDVRYPLSEMMLRHYEDQGIVRCRKRIGASRNIDFKERKKAGFVSAFQRGVSTKEALYTDEELRDYRTEKRLREAQQMLSSLAPAIW